MGIIKKLLANIDKPDVSMPRIRKVEIESRVAKAFGVGSPDYNLIMKACEASSKTLRGGKRNNGEVLINHERAMFIIAFDDLGIRDVALLTAIFMHDMFEDFPRIWPLHRIEAEFSKEVRDLVAAVTKPRRKKYQRLSKFSQTVIRRVRRGGAKAILLKLIDRMHNMPTLYGDEKKCRFKIVQTIEYILPMAIQCDVTQAKQLILPLMEATYKQAQIHGVDVSGKITL